MDGVMSMRNQTLFRRSIRPSPMAEDRRLRCSGEDRISGLPDELLHCILVCLGCTRAAARTSLLSHRWRHTWAHLPELVFDGGRDVPASFLDSIDEAITSYSSSPVTLDRLFISLSTVPELSVPAERVRPWLLFAAERVLGELCLVMPRWKMSRGPQWPELELPLCGRAKTITFDLQHSWRLRPPSAGLFTALTGLAIMYAQMEGCEITALVGKQCPCLRDLELNVTLVDASVVSIRSDSLHSLRLGIANALLVEVIAPGLEKLSLFLRDAVRISAPKLVELVWISMAHQDYQFDDVSRHLRLLNIWDQNCTMASLWQKVHEVDELKLRFNIPWATAGYQRFLDETNKLPKCKILNVTFWSEYDHSFAPLMLHLLRNCSSTKKVSLKLIDRIGYFKVRYSCPASCPCRLGENRRVDSFTIDSLEEVAIISCISSSKLLEHVELLSRCNATSLKKLVIRYNKRFHATLETKEVCKKICSMYQPNVEVEFYVGEPWRWVHFDWSLANNVM